MTGWWLLVLPLLVAAGLWVRREMLRCELREDVDKLCEDVGKLCEYMGRGAGR